MESRDRFLVSALDCSISVTHPRLEFKQNGELLSSDLTGEFLLRILVDHKYP